MLHKTVEDGQSSIMTPLVFRELFMNFISSNKWLLLGFSVFVFLTFPVESVVLPHFYSKLFDGITEQSKSSTLGSIFENVAQNWRSGNAAGTFYIIALIWIGVIIAYSIKQSFESVIVPKYLSYVRQMIFSRIIERHQDNVSDIRVGEEISRILDVSRNMRDVLSWGLDELAPMFLTICIIAVFFCTVHWSIGCTMIAGIAITLLVLYHMGRVGIDAAAKREKYYLSMSEKLHDSFGNLMNIAINNTQSKEIASNAEKESKHTELYMKQMRITRNIVVTLSVVSTITFLSTLVLAYYLVKKGTIASTTFVSLWLVLMYYIGFMVRFSNEFPHFFVKYGIIKHSKEFLHDILSYRTERTVNSGLEEGDVRFQDVSFTYGGSSAPTLVNFNLRVQPREKVALLGTSGSGKTTCMKLLTAMHRVDTGRILVDGTDVNEYDLVYLRNRVNYVNQRTQLFNKSVVKNMQYGNKATKQEIIQLLREHKLDVLFSSLRYGLSTTAGVNGSNLSGGMQRVCMLVRGLLKPEARVIVLDEPLAGLDARTRQKVIAFIKARCEGKTLIVITHDREIVPHLDRVVNFGDLNKTVRHDEGRADGNAPTPTTPAVAAVM